MCSSLLWAESVFNWQIPNAIRYTHNTLIISLKDTTNGLVFSLNRQLKHVHLFIQHNGRRSWCLKQEILRQTSVHKKAPTICMAPLELRFSAHKCALAKWDKWWLDHRKRSDARLMRASISLRLDDFWSAQAQRAPYIKVLWCVACILKGLRHQFKILFPSHYFGWVTMSTFCR